MIWEDEPIPELWSRLQKTGKAVVLYGMGNGADKILNICNEKGIPVREVFASDAFVRGQSFRGMTVRRWSDVKETCGAQNVIVLLSFGSSLPEVLQNIQAIAAEAELYAPDVPVFGDGLFDLSFAHAHREELTAARELLSDEESRRIFDLILRYKLTGELPPLLAARSNPAQTMQTLVRPEELKITADLGAYNGDSVRELLSFGAHPDKIYAVEPDTRNFRKLEEYAVHEERTTVLPVHAAAWNTACSLRFDGSGNRNASAGLNRSSVLADRPGKMVDIPALPLDQILNGSPVNYIKYDVEGSEREALEGSAGSIRRSLPTLLVSLYHRNEDLFALPLYIHREFPEYRGYYLRRFGGIPAWDLNLYVRKEPIHE